MRIGFIGAGRVGCTLGKYLKNHGVEVTGYFSRNLSHSEEAAKFTDTLSYDNVSKLVSESDAIFLTVSDSFIEEVFLDIEKKADLTGKIICHTSGALSSSVFSSSKYQVYGYSIHPIYAFSDRFEAYKNFQQTTITIEGDEKYIANFEELFRNASLKTAVIDKTSKVKYHAASVYVSNLVCGMYMTGVKLLTECGFEKDAADTALRNLFIKNAEGISEKGAVAQLTGPLERGDYNTVKKHLDALDGVERELYRLASLETLEIAKEKNKDRSYSEIEGLLGNLEEFKS